MQEPVKTLLYNKAVAAFHQTHLALESKYPHPATTSLWFPTCNVVEGDQATRSKRVFHSNHIKSLDLQHSEIESCVALAYEQDDVDPIEESDVKEQDDSQTSPLIPLSNSLPERVDHLLLDGLPPTLQTTHERTVSSIQMEELIMPTMEEPIIHSLKEPLIPSPVLESSCIQKSASSHSIQSLKESTIYTPKESEPPSNSLEPSCSENAVSLDSMPRESTIQTHSVPTPLGSSPSFPSPLMTSLESNIPSPLLVNTLLELPSSPTNQSCTPRFVPSILEPLSPSSSPKYDMALTHLTPCSLEPSPNTHSKDPFKSQIPSLDSIDSLSEQEKNACLQAMLELKSHLVQEMDSLHILLSHVAY